MGKTTCYAAMALMLMSVTTPLHAQDASGGPLSRLIGRIRHHHSPALSNTPAANPVSPREDASSGCSQGGSDPYGFMSILNRLRAAAGLHPVVYDAGLSSWA